MNLHEKGDMFYEREHPKLNKLNSGLNCIANPLIEGLFVIRLRQIRNYTEANLIRHIDCDIYNRYLYRAMLGILMQ